MQKEAVYSRCGMRCDLCLIYRPNVVREDRREVVCAAYRKMFPGFEPDPKAIICDGCLCESPDAVLFDPGCKARACVLEKGLRFCGDCEGYPCAIFPAEPDAEEVRRKIEVEKQWTWEDEALMAAHACKKHMDEYRRKRHDA